MGVNQALAAARFGARTALAGQTGEDESGQRLRAHLAAAGVDITHVDADPRTATGLSIAIGGDAGPAGGVAVAGANLTIDAQAIAARWAGLWQARVLLLQNELSEAVNLAAASKAHAAGARIILNAAPPREVSPILLNMVEVMVVNGAGARLLSGSEDPDRALPALHAPRWDVVLTRGAEGLSLMTRKGVRRDVPALPVRPVASHGAGDCFSGALAARLAAGDDVEFACRFASAAAARFVSTPG
jgi:ribokinase